MIEDIKRDIKSVGEWFKSHKSAKRMKLDDIYEFMTSEFNYDRMNLEKTRSSHVDAEFRCLELKGKLKDQKKLEELNKKLFEYLFKTTTIVSQIVTENKKLQLEIKELIAAVEDLKSDRYLVVKKKPMKTPKAEPMRIKSGSKTSKIIKKVKEGK